MTADKNCEELRPCPFCGNKPKFIDASHILFHDPQYDNGDYKCCGDYFQVKYEDWQRAYCWQELDKVKAQRDSLLDELVKIRGVALEHVKGTPLYDRWLGATVSSEYEIVGLITEALQGAGEGE